MDEKRLYFVTIACGGKKYGDYYVLSTNSDSAGKQVINALEGRWSHKANLYVDTIRLIATESGNGTPQIIVGVQ